MSVAHMSKAVPNSDTMLCMSKTSCKAHSLLVLSQILMPGIKFD